MKMVIHFGRNVSIALGEHDVNQVIKLSIHVNKDGIKANMNDKNNTGKIDYRINKKNKGYIFEKLLQLKNQQTKNQQLKNRQTKNR